MNSQIVLAAGKASKSSLHGKLTAPSPPQPPVVDLEQERSHDKQLLIQSREFAQEQIGRSWWHLCTTLVVILAAAVVAAVGPFWLRPLGSVLLGLTIVRMFILYHDYQHNAIFKNDRLAGMILSSYGYLMLTPPSVWRRSHNHHHRNNSKLFGASIGSFPIMTLENYRAASSSDQLEYRIARSPWIIVLGYFSVFLFGMCLRPLLLDFRKHWDAAISLVVHFGILAATLWFAGWTTTVLLLVVPVWIATASGAYLFYAQHNFPSARIRPRDQWTYTGAALQSSSYMMMNPVMHWLTGNIGYHHVHHLNDKIPFYRLPETMAALAALGSPNTTSLKPSEILGCLRLKLWDASRDRFITFAEARQQA